MLNPGFDKWKQRRRNSLPSDCPRYKCSRYSFLMIVKQAADRLSSSVSSLHPSPCRCFHCVIVTISKLLPSCSKTSALMVLEISKSDKLKIPTLHDCRFCRFLLAAIFYLYLHNYLRLYTSARPDPLYEAIFTCTGNPVRSIGTQAHHTNTQEEAGPGAGQTFTGTVQDSTVQYSTLERGSL